jgi:hypothetical protein
VPQSFEQGGSLQRRLHRSVFLVLKNKCAGMSDGSLYDCRKRVAAAQGHGADFPSGFERGLSQPAA